MPNFDDHHPSSYRDPSGFIFEKNGIIYRQVNLVFKEHYDLFIQSGCYDKLVSKGYLVPHKTLTDAAPGAYLILEPERIPFISYAYEWSFDMLRDAALLTLDVLKEAIACGMILKDATPYNVQWLNGKLVFIDTLSFEKYDEAEPWIAYRQFCECFLSPLLLMHYSKNPLQRISLAYPEGIPLSNTKSLLPGRSKFSLHTYLHIHLHAGVAGKKKNDEKRKLVFSKQKLLNLVRSLETLIRGLKAPNPTTAWSGYYEEASQRKDYLQQKTAIIESWIDKAGPIQMAADLGANDGVFSRLLSTRQIVTLAADQDPICINNLYREIKTNGEKFLQPMVMDLADPSPATGVNNKERDAFTRRLHVDLVLALALIHHLSIGRNIPFDMVAEFFAAGTRKLIIEWVPKDDPKVQEMLAQKKDIYDQYDQVNFEKAFGKYFSVTEKEGVPGTTRVLYLMERVDPTS